MAIFKEISPSNVRTSRSYLNQLVDILQSSVSGSVSRRKYQVWATGGVGPGVTASLFQTVYDTDFTLQTANPIFDLTVGLYFSGSTVQTAKTGEDSAGKLLFPASSLQMREKIDLYKQFSSVLLGDANAQFFAPFGSTTSGDGMDAAAFVCMKRLFARDSIKRETFAMKFFQTASIAAGRNLDATSEYGASIYTDVGSAANKITSFGGNVGNLVDASNTSRNVGLLFYDRGIAVLDLAKVMSGTQHVSGVISAMSNISSPLYNPGQTLIGYQDTVGNPNAKFIPDFLVSGSIDNIVDHIGSCRFSSGSQTAMTFQNITNINSTLFFLDLGPDDFNYSSNPTYTDADSRIVVIDPGQEDTQSSFTFITKLGLYDANDNLLALGSTSRPLEKSAQKSLSVQLRLDF